MELVEQSNFTIKQDAVHSFNMTRNRFYVANLGSTFEIIVMEMKHLSTAIQSLSYAIETVKIPRTHPAHKFVTQADLPNIYLKSDALERQFFGLDPIYVSHMSEESFKDQANAVFWVPDGVFPEPTLVILSIRGACELRHRDMIKREWNTFVYNFNEVLYEIFDLQSSITIESFDKLREVVEDVTISAISWNANEESLRNTFVISNISGWLLLFRISDNHEVVYCEKYKTSLGRISLLYYIDNFICASSVTGVIKLFKHDGPQISEVETLWSKQDRIAIKKLQMSFSKEHNAWIVITTKVAHVVVFVLTPEGKLKFKASKYLGNMDITGFDMLDEHQYIFSTITGAVMLVSLDITNSALLLTTKPVKYNIDFKHYQILGLVASPNRVIWTFALFHKKPFVHTSVYASRDTTISVCRLDEQKAVNIIMDYRGGMEQLVDCAEVIRLEVLNTGKTNKFQHLSLISERCDGRFLRNLQLALLIKNAELSFQRLKHTHVKKELVDELEFITISVECVYIIMRLQCFLRKRNCNDFQVLSGKCMKSRLRIIQARLLEMETALTDVRDILHESSESVLAKLGSRFDEAYENCLYCDLDINFDTLKCANSHETRRCALSWIQVPLFSTAVCSSCNRIYQEDREKLLSLFDEDVNLQCIYCRFSLSSGTKRSLIW